MTDKARELARELVSKFQQKYDYRTQDRDHLILLAEDVIAETERRKDEEYSKIENTPDSVLKAKEDIDIAHLKGGVSDGCVCGLCEAARVDLDGYVADKVRESVEDALHQLAGGYDTQRDEAKASLAVYAAKKEAVKKERRETLEAAEAALAAEHLSIKPEHRIMAALRGRR